MERCLQSGEAGLWKGCVIVYDSYVVCWQGSICTICYGKKPAKRPQMLASGEDTVLTLWKSFTIFSSWYSREEGRIHNLLIPVSMRSLTTQNLTGLLENKMFVFHKPTRKKQVYWHGAQFWLWLRNLQKKIDREIVRVKITEDHLDGLV